MITMAVPIIKLDSLPLQSLGSGNTATVPVVLNNTTTVRVPWSDFVAETVKVATTIPAAPSSSGEEQSLISSSEGLYVYSNGSWRKSPLYSSNWEDLTNDTRFLLVNALMQLSDQQIKNVYDTLKLAIATQEKAGLVRAMTDVEAKEAAGAAVKVNADGTMFVPSASDTQRGTVVLGEGQQGPVASVDYVDTRIDSIPRASVPAATSSAIGGVLSGGTGGAFMVDVEGEVTLRSATYTEHGIVKLAETVRQGASGVPTAGAVYLALDNAIKGIGNVTTEAPTKPGLVSVAVKGAWEDTSNPSAGAGTLSGPIYVKDNSTGAIDVYPATAYVPGVVLLLKDASKIASLTRGSNYETVPTVDAMVAYVTDMTGKQELEINMPPATRGDLGGVVIGSGLNVDTTGLISVKQADQATLGGVVLASSINSGVGVPTAVMVKSYVTNEVSRVDDSVEELRRQLEYLEQRINNAGQLS